MLLFMRLINAMKEKQKDRLDRVYVQDENEFDGEFTSDFKEHGIVE